MLKNYQLHPNDFEITAIRSQGPGGQHVNKTSTAIQLRFNLNASSLPDAAKQRIHELGDSRLTKDGWLVIKSQLSRSQDQNKADAIAKLQKVIDDALVEPKVRRPSRPTLGSVRRRLAEKDLRSKLKASRQSVE